MEGQSRINFSSNDYLGLATHSTVLEAVRQVLEHWGVGATSSRLISGTSVIHQDLERALAAFFGKEAALLFPSGYMTNLAVVSSLMGPGDAVIVDRLCHASIIDAVKLSGARLFVYGHTDVASARKAVERSASYRRKMLVTDSVFSMDGDFAPVNELAALCREQGVLSVLDEAHAIGVWGPEGKGLAAPGTWDILVGTLSKALGSQGGFFCASQEIVDLVINKGRPFIFTTALSPAAVAAAHASLSVIQEDEGQKKRQRLQSLAQRLRDGLQTQNHNIAHSQSHIVPILLKEVSRTLACADFLWKEGIYAPAIRPPTVHAGECRLRFSVTADHTEEDVDQLLKALSIGEKQ
jgi:8-amino-7-oxononanoate synthase